MSGRILPCLFDTLVDFVELELASMYGSKHRSAKAGIEYLDWASSLIFDDSWIEKTDPCYGMPTPQALGAREIKFLYEWYTVTYKNRPDPYDDSGWMDICDKNREEHEGLMFLDRESTLEEKTSLDNLRTIEEQYEAEDTEMLIRLVKVRGHLWT